jgi:hypothetical protein
MSTDVIKTESAAVPAWMKKASTGASIGNIDASDLKPPQLKMLAGMSPEVINGTPGASPGNFWMTIHNRALGHSVTGTFILVRKTYQIWAPKGAGLPDQKGPLASSSNGLTWDVPNQTFEVRFAMNPRTYKWKIGKLVTDYDALEWGTQQPEDPRSKPIATLTYNLMWVIDMPNGGSQLCVFVVSRTGEKPTKIFLSALGTHDGVDHYFQRYRIVQRKLTGPTGDPYFSFDFEYIGNIQDHAEAERMQGYYKQYSKSGFVADFESEAVTEPTKTFNTDEEEIPF